MSEFEIKMIILKWIFDDHIINYTVFLSSYFFLYANLDVSIQIDVYVF